MIVNYLTLALRNLFKRKLYAFINIFGLALGIAVCLVILRYVDFELSYDSFHDRADRIYRTTTTYYRNGELRSASVLSGYAQGPALLADIPEVKSFVRTHPMYGGAVISYQRPVGEPSTFNEDKIQWVDSTFLDVFTYHARQGDIRTALDKPNSMVITRKAAQKYFSKGEDPLGKILQISGGWSDGTYEVTAVLDDVPENAHLNFDFLLPVHNLLRNEQYTGDSGWGWNNFITYVELQPLADASKAEEKMPALIEKYQGKDFAESNTTAKLALQPIRKIHTTPGLDHEPSATISTYTIYFLVVIAIFILAIAWINYINLSTARATERAREVGIKKAIGALKSQLITQFVFESVLVNLFSIVLAVLIAIALIPVLGQIVGKELSFDFTDPRLWLILTLLLVVGSTVSGAYPAFVLSSFNTTDVLKGRALVKGFSIRKALVVFQFASSLILVAGTFAIYRQMMFMRDQDKGLTMDRMLIVNCPRVVERKLVKQKLINFRSELRQFQGISGVTTSGAIPGGGYNWGTGVRKEGTEREASKTASIVWVDPDFVNTYQISLLAGRNFNPEIKSDMESILINEASLEAFGLIDAEAALKERLILGDDTVAILGVLKNYHWNSLKSEHTPFLLKADTISGRCFSILLQQTNMNETIAKIEKAYKEAFPGNPFDFYFLEDYFNNQYKSDQQFAKIFGLFATLAIVIACLGLWGLAAFTTSQKLREIGIRKVLGASVSSIMSLLSWQFLKLVLVAGVVALPLTWYGIHTWLGNFAYRIGMNWDLFVVPVVILGLLSLGTVSLQILRGAHINPAKILRSE
ncbi:MAG TPA: ABC transporter permease [Chryseolinea sp.]|nr:ABC transporter permease [Chryseolinea sp.]